MTGMQFMEKEKESAIYNINKEDFSDILIRNKEPQDGSFLIYKVRKEKFHDR